MTVCEYGSGKWKAEVFISGKRMVYKAGFDRKKEAKAWHDAEKRKLLESPALKDTSFEELLEHFKTWHLPSVRPGTRTRYMVDIDQRIARFFRYLPVAKITAAQIESFKVECSKTLSPKSVNNCLHTLRLILNKAVKWKMLKENPYSVDSLAIPQKPYVWWDKEEYIQRFIEAAKESRYYAVYLTALETGLRYGELVGLSTRDVDLESGTIHVHRQWLEREGVYGPPKHGRERWVDFSPVGLLADTLRPAVRSANGNERLFRTGTGSAPTKSGVAHKYFRAAIKRAKVPLIPFHGLRHTFASWYMIRHDNVWDLAAILGHASIKTTMRYAHHSKRARRKPLDLASITHKSRTVEEENYGTNENDSGKKWRDGRDSNPYIPTLKVIGRTGT